MASAQILTNGKALYAYSGSVWYGLNTSGNLVNATRWQKVATGGETTLSGNDDTGDALSYTPGFEQVFLNGVLLARGLDYTATDGTTITGLAALTAGYIVEVIAYNNINVGNTYTQAQIDNKVANTFTRWVETLSASATVLSGLDDNSNTLSYTPGLEQVYVNGILLLPSEYTATSGYSIVLSEAAVSGDVIQVYTLKNFRVPNTYTITQTDDQFLTKTSASSTYLSQSSASGTYLSQTSASSTYQLKSTEGATLITTSSFSTQSTVNIDNCFSSTYSHYRIVFYISSSSSTIFRVRYRTSGSTNSTTNYNYQQFSYNSSTLTGVRSLSDNNFKIGYNNNTDHAGEILVLNPFASKATSGHARISGGVDANLSDCRFTGTTSFDGISFIPDAGTLTGSISIYGMKE